MINVGIIGYGKMGHIRHKVISLIKDAKVISFYDPAKIDNEIKLMQTSDHIIKHSRGGENG